MVAVVGKRAVHQAREVVVEEQGCSLLEAPARALRV
jgi:hypothetical protein